MSGRAVIEGNYFVLNSNVTWYFCNDFATNNVVWGKVLLINNEYALFADEIAEVTNAVKSPVIRN